MGMLSKTGLRIWYQLLLLLPTPNHAILHYSPLLTGPLVVLWGDLHHKLKRTISTMDLVGTTLTVVYVSLRQMCVLRDDEAHYIPSYNAPTGPTTGSLSTRSHK